MSKKQFIYESRTLLSCNPCGGDLIICVAPELTANGAPFIEGFLVGINERGTAGNVWYGHIIQYDDMQLSDPAQNLQGCAVKGLVCRGCITSYIDWKIAQVLAAIPEPEPEPEPPTPEP